MFKIQKFAQKFIHDLQKIETEPSKLNAGPKNTKYKMSTWAISGHLPKTKSFFTNNNIKKKNPLPLKKQKNL